MNLNLKITVFFTTIAVSLLAILMVISLYAFRTYSISSATEHIRTAAEIVRVHLTESMINGVIDKRASFLKRLMEVKGLAAARVVRSPMVERQFGRGLNEEQPADPSERRVLETGTPTFLIVERDGDTLMRGIVPFVASAQGSPNCLQCHEVSEGAVLGAVSLDVSIGSLVRNATLSVAGMVGIVALFTGLALVFVRRMVRPVALTAENVEAAVGRALRGDFKAQVKQVTSDEIGKIAADVNRLLVFLDNGLTTICESVTRLTQRTPGADENQLTTTIDMVSGLTDAAHFKQAIEEDETKAEIHQRLVRTLEQKFAMTEYSLYENVANTTQMVTLFVDGETGAACRWCDPQVLVRSEACRAKRTGHMVDGVLKPDICYSFASADGAADRKYVCLPIIQAGRVGAVLQIVTTAENESKLLAQIPYISVYLREAAPVLETKRLMETLRESSLRDPMTGLNNRRFLEEYVETLVASVQRRGSALAILMLDLDYFKMVNDTYGHDAGDTVIKALAKVLRQAVRSSDMVIRFGGEEFLIILVDASKEQADAVGEKIRATVEALEIATTAIKLKKTISIGISDFPGDSDTFWQAVKFADVALYRAKETGRNRVIRFDPAMWSDDMKY